jgi:acetyl esterase/lipase
MSIAHGWLGVVTAVVMTSTNAAEPKAIPLYEAPRPTAEGMRELVEKDPQGLTSIRNVTEPTLTPFFPKTGRANGASVIVLPGGGFMALAWDHEGTMVAKKLAQKGVTAFVLKYRLEKTPEDKIALTKHSLQRISEYEDARAKADPARPNPLRPAALAAAEDAAAAMRLIRSRAKEWKLDPRRVGLVGFSAGAIAALYAATGDGERPDYIAAIYGALDRPVPRDAPPIFIAASVDDPIMTPPITLALFDAWRAAGRPAELHLFEGGGHGYGLRTTGLSSDHWFDEFLWWMDSRKLFSPAAPKAPPLKAGVRTDLTGKWRFTVDSTSGTTTPTAVIEHKGTSLSGTYHSQILGERKMTGAVEDGVFTLNVENPVLKLVFTGTADTRDLLAGTVSYNGQPAGTFTAKREPAQ